LNFLEICTLHIAKISKQKLQEDICYESRARHTDIASLNFKVACAKQAVSRLLLGKLNDVADKLSSPPLRMFKAEENAVYSCQDNTDPDFCKDCEVMVLVLFLHHLMLCSFTVG
jgi:hypothetical protein